MQLQHLLKRSRMKVVMLKNNTAGVIEGQVIDLDPQIALEQIAKGNAKAVEEEVKKVKK